MPDPTPAPTPIAAGPGFSLQSFAIGALLAWAVFSGLAVRTLQPPHPAPPPAPAPPGPGPVPPPPPAPEPPPGPAPAPSDPLAARMGAYLDAVPAAYEAAADAIGKGYCGTLGDVDKVLAGATAQARRDLGQALTDAAGAAIDGTGKVLDRAALAAAYRRAAAGGGR